MATKSTGFLSSLWGDVTGGISSLGSTYLNFSNAQAKNTLEANKQQFQFNLDSQQQTNQLALDKLKLSSATTSSQPSLLQQLLRGQQPAGSPPIIHTAGTSTGLKLSPIVLVGLAIAGWAAFSHFKSAR